MKKTLVLLTLCLLAPAAILLALLTAKSERMGTTADNP